MRYVFLLALTFTILTSDFGLSEETRVNSGTQLVPLSQIPADIFITDRDSVFNAVDGAQVLRTSMEEALKLPECRPAQRDSEGNWGEVTNGWQLSLRFPKATYSVGEPVEGMIILRNVSTNIMRYPVALSGGFAITWARKDRDLKLRQELREPEGFSSSMGPTLYPRTQREFHVRFDQVLSTNSPNTFILSVRTRVPKIHEQGIAEVSSGEAAIQVLSDSKKEH